MTSPLERGVVTPSECKASGLGGYRRDNSGLPPSTGVNLRGAKCS